LRRHVLLKREVRAFLFLLGLTKKIKEVKMEKNIGGVDRAIRIILGLLIIGVGLYYKNWWGLVGIIPLLSGIRGSCMMYKLLGINTCKIKK